MESSGDSTQKIGLETDSGDFYPALARTACAEPLRPFKKVHQRSLKPPSRPQLDYHLVRLGTNPVGSAAYLTLPLPPVYLPLDAFA